MATNLAKLNCAESVIKTLIANGIDTLYCLPGVQNDDFFDALARIGGAIRPINARHEQATAYMALGAALATGEAVAALDHAEVELGGHDVYRPASAAVTPAA